VTGVQTCALPIFANNLDGVFQKSVLQGAQRVLGNAGMTVEAVELGGVADPAAVQQLMTEVAQRAGGLLVISNAVSDAGLSTAMEQGAVATLISHHTQQ